MERRKFTREFTSFVRAIAADAFEGGVEQVDDFGFLGKRHLMAALRGMACPA